MKSSVFAIVLFLASWSPAFAGQTVFGIALGEQLTLPPCPRPSLDNPHQPVPMCVLVANEFAPQRTLETGATEVHAKWAYDGQHPPGPGYKKENGHLMVDIVEGKVVKVWFSTKGVIVQDETLAALVSKYGKPSVLDRKTKQNAFGRVVPYLSAYWKLPDATVFFDGITDRIDDGFVSVSVPSYERASEKALQKQKATQPHL